MTGRDTENVSVEFDNSFEVPLPPAEAWTVLMDIRRIAPCMPGAELTEVVDERNYKGKVYRTHLLRRSYREDGKVKNETLGNLSHLPEPLIDDRVFVE